MSGDIRSAPRLTIVIPTVNRAALVGRAVESALAQSFPDVEIIVSNNGSSDGTRDVLRRYRDPRLRIFHRDETIPAADHGNFLLGQARGEFFLGLSDDDWIEPDFARTVVALFDRHPEVSFAYTGCLIHYADVALPARTGPGTESGVAFLTAFLGGQRYVCWSACVTRTADLRRIGPIPPETVCGDMFYWTKLAAWGDVGCAPELVSHYVCYRDAGDNQSGGTPVLAWAKEVEALARDHRDLRAGARGTFEHRGAPARCDRVRGAFDCGPVRVERSSWREAARPPADDRPQLPVPEGWCPDTLDSSGRVHPGATAASAGPRPGCGGPPGRRPGVHLTMTVSPS